MTLSRKKNQNETKMLGWIHAPENACAGNQCIAKPAGGFTATFSNLDMRGIPIEQASLSDIFSAEYYAAMVQAAKFGFLYSFLTATPNEIFNSYFIKSNFTTNQIFYAKQTISALTMLSLSAYLGMTDIKSLFVSVGAPAASAGMKYSGYSEATSQYAPIVVMIATQLTSDVANCSKTVMSLLSGLGGGWLGQKFFSTGYNMIGGLFSSIGHALMPDAVNMRYKK